jgi:pimeloyl-ACP methyl ester carboxylesterase
MQGKYIALLFASVLGLATVAVAQSAPPTSDIKVPGPNGPLKGTLTGEVAKNRPVVLIIPGSGPTDRDGNNPLGIKAAPYRLLAEGLAQRHIVSVRIDKRGMFASAAAVPDANAVTVDDYVHDTDGWIAAIRQRTGAHCVWLLGHSEGGLIALATAARQSGYICGLVLVSTAGRPLGDVLKAQLKANPANAALVDPASKAIDTLVAGGRVDVTALPTQLAPFFQPAVQRFLISAFALDPAKLIKQSAKPILILQGERDLQVSVADANRLKAADPAASLVLLPAVNHVLKQVNPDDLHANLATYANPNIPIAPAVVEAIAHFVNSRNR